MSKLIGIYGGPVAHDGGAVYVKDGQIQSIIQEERPRRVKVADDPDASPLLSLSRIQKEFNLYYEPSQRTLLWCILHFWFQ